LYKRKGNKNTIQDIEDAEMADIQDQNDRGTRDEEGQDVIQLSIEDKKKRLALIQRHFMRTLT